MLKAQRLTHRGAQQRSKSSSSTDPPGVVNSSPPAVTLWGRCWPRPQVDMISFTGSTATGRAVMADTAAAIKKVFTELGGSRRSSCDDADLTLCQRNIGVLGLHARRAGSAQSTRRCAARPVMKKAVIAAATMSSIRPGDPNDPGAVCGPLISARPSGIVSGASDLAVMSEGSHAVARGRRIERSVLHRAHGHRRVDQPARSRPGRSSDRCSR